MKEAAEIPVGLYYLIGVMVISNLGTIGALISFIFKAGKFVANTEKGIENAHDTAVRAHKRLDRHEELHHAP